MRVKSAKARAFYAKDAAERRLGIKDKAGIAVAEYWTALPPKIEFEWKIREIYFEAEERLERWKNLKVLIQISAQIFKTRIIER
jgi:hypothetical protein